MKNVKINIGPNGTKDNAIRVNFDNTTEIANQQEIVDRDFVNIEVKRSINEIVDYNNIKFKPVNPLTGNEPKTIRYEINLLTPESKDDVLKTYLDTTRWSNAGFVVDDFAKLRKVFTKTFVRLDFYDSDDNSNQRLLFFTTLIPKLTGKKVNGITTFKTPDEVLLDFKLSSNRIDVRNNSESYNLFYFKDEIVPTIKTEIYMKATFFNAKDGKVINLMSSNDPNQSIDKLLNNVDPLTNKVTNGIYTKYNLFMDGKSGYCYEIDNEYSKNNSSNDTEITIKLYEISSK